MTSSETSQKWDQLQLERGASFFQSAAWAEFQKSVGSDYHLLAGNDWSCLLLERSTPVGKYWFAPYGPTLNNLSALPIALQVIKAEAKQRRIDWLRLEPVCLSATLNELAQELEANHGRPAPRSVDPPLTRIVDLSPDEDALMQSLSPKTRTRIRRNQRESTVDFKTSVDPADISLFTSMLEEVSQRSGARFFPASYFQKQAEYLMPLGFLHLELAYSDGHALGATIIHDYGTASTYTYAASLPEARKKDVSELLLWQAMLNAKRRGKTSFDVFGIAPPNADASHPWYGFSTFKEKFGGQILERVGTWDIPLTSKYKAYRLVRRIRPGL